MEGHLKLHLKIPNHEIYKRLFQSKVGVYIFLFAPPPPGKGEGKGKRKKGREKEKGKGKVEEGIVKEQNEREKGEREKGKGEKTPKKCLKELGGTFKLTFLGHPNAPLYY